MRIGFLNLVPFGVKGGGMGGFGSGEWLRMAKKPTVDESLTLEVRNFRNCLLSDSSGDISWTLANGAKASLGFTISCSRRPVVTLRYRWDDQEDISIPVRFETTVTKFDGTRYWFTCPLIVRGVACNRRAAKLHLPPGARYFGCRACHGLTYRSSQEAHRRERLIAGISRMERWMDQAANSKR
jgi:hypothetical protein